MSIKDLIIDSKTLETKFLLPRYKELNYYQIILMLPEHQDIVSVWLRLSGSCAGHLDIKQERYKYCAESVSASAYFTFLSKYSIYINKKFVLPKAISLCDHHWNVVQELIEQFNVSI